MAGARGPWFELANASDLLAKLRRDLKRIEHGPMDPDAAFDFFVTAHHLLEWWVPPGDKEAVKAARTAVRRSVIGQVCADLANGAKHFLGPSLTGIHEGDFSDEFDRDHDISHLVVRPTEPEAMRELGAEIDVFELAHRVVAEWEARLSASEQRVPHVTQ